MDNFFLFNSTGKYVIYNGKTVCKNEFDKFGLSVSQDERIFYEVIRCIQGVPLFLEDHLERLFNSHREIKRSINEIIRDIGSLIDSEKIFNGNIRIESSADVLLVYPSKYNYPDESFYKKGVNTGTIVFERKNPNRKVFSSDYVQTVANKLKSKGPFGDYFEILLLSKDKRITEGSKSNVFFTSKNKIYTAPEEEILKGITRKYVLKAIENSNGKLESETLSVDEIGDKCDGCFLTGTSINVLPVYSVENVVMDSAKNPMIKNIMVAYEEIVNEYINKRI